MNNAFKRTIAGAVLGTTLAVGGAALAAVPASAASLWTPSGTPQTPTTPGTAGDIIFRLAYNGSSTSIINSVDFTINAPEAVDFVPETFGKAYSGDAGYLRVTEQLTSTPTFVHCDLVSSKQVHCSGAFVGADNQPVAGRWAVPLNTNDTMFVRLSGIVPVGSSGAADQPITATGTVGTSAGTQSVPTTTVATVSPATIVDTPVIAPAIAGIALLGAAGVGGGIFAKRRKKATANA